MTMAYQMLSWTRCLTLIATYDHGLPNVKLLNKIPHHSILKRNIMKRVILVLYRGLRRSEMTMDDTS